MRHALGVHEFLTAIVRRRTWAELLYVLVGLPLGVAGFAFVAAMLSLSAGLAITLVGFPLLMLSLVVARGWGAAYRSLGRSLLGVDVANPLPPVGRPGLIRNFFR